MALTPSISHSCQKYPKASQPAILKNPICSCQVRLQAVLHYQQPLMSGDSHSHPLPMLLSTLPGSGNHYSTCSSPEGPSLASAFV